MSEDGDTYRDGVQDDIRGAAARGEPGAGRGARVGVGSNAVRGAGQKRAAGKSRARDRVFISYSHDDRKWLSMIVTMSKPLVWSDNLHLWSDAEIAPGEKWEAEIAEALEAAKVAVLLVSPQFFASDFIMKKELPYILKAAESKRLRLLWVAVTTSFVDRTKLAAYEAAHDPARPLDTLTAPKRSQALREICEEISRALGLE